MGVLAAIAVLLGTESSWGYATMIGDTTWYYSINTNTWKATVTGANPANGNLAIPASLGGCPVTGIGSYAFENCHQLGSVVIPDGVTNIAFKAFAYSSLSSVNIPADVTDIGANVFCGCSNLVSVTCSAMLTSIPVSAFYACSSLRSIHLPQSLTRIGENAFEDCRALQSLSIPNGVTNIGDKAFAGCSGVASVSISERLTSIPQSAFSGCSSLTFLRIPDSVSAIGMYAFSGCGNLESILMNNNVKSLSWWVFSGCSNLTSVAVPQCICSEGLSDIGGFPSAYNHITNIVICEGVTNIAYSFSRCSALKSVTIPNSVTSIGEAAFRDCHNLTSISIPNTVTNIGKNAFSNCKALTSLLIPPSVTEIGYSAFYGCNGLTTVGIPDSVTGIGAWAFGYCNGLESVTIPDSVTNIGGSAFSYCSGLTLVTLSDSITSISSSVFDNCISLKIVELPQWACTKRMSDIFSDTYTNITHITIRDGTTHISGQSFSGCSGLQSVSLPNSLTNIGERSFYNCQSLKSLSIPESVTSIGSNAFYNCNKLTEVYIPDLPTWCRMSFGNAYGNPLYYAGHLFVGDEEVTDLTIPDGVVDIGNFIFYGCKGLSSVTIPNSVSDIGWSAFCECSGLTSAVLGKGVTNIAQYAFYDCNGLATLMIPDSVMTIGDHAFDGCSRLTTVGIPQCVCTGRLSSVFSNAYTRITNAVIGAAVTNIGYATFYGCNGLKSVTISDSMTEIGAWAFGNCPEVVSLTIPDSVVRIGSNVFYGCTGLTDLSVPGAWYGTDKLKPTAVPPQCTIVYRGVEQLTIDTEKLGDGTLGRRYETKLSASGGIAPYEWKLSGNQYVEKGGESTFAQTGIAQGCQGDDTCWEWTLPFEFPFFGHTYTKAKINSNGALSFGNASFSAHSYNSSTFMSVPIIAVLWTDLSTQYGDIFIEHGENAAMVRWKGAYYAGGGSIAGDVNISATLYKDGRIVLSYGEGNARGGYVGISAGDGTMVHFSEKNNSGNMSNADDVIFVPSRLPEGLELTADGVLQGTPLEVGQHLLSVVVADSKGIEACKELLLAVLEESSENVTVTTPVPVPYTWLQENAAKILAENTGDYEATAHAEAANGMPVWKCYLAGLSTTDAQAEFKVQSISFVDGEVQLEWTPDLNDNGTQTNRTYVIQGKQSMDDEWDSQTPSSRFFRVKVQMPAP